MPPGRSTTPELVFCRTSRRRSLSNPTPEPARQPAADGQPLSAPRLRLLGRAAMLYRCRGHRPARPFEIMPRTQIQSRSAASGSDVRCGLSRAHWAARVTAIPNGRHSGTGVPVSWVPARLSLRLAALALPIPLSRCHVDARRTGSGIQALTIEKGTPKRKEELVHGYRVRPTAAAGDLASCIDPRQLSGGRDRSRGAHSRHRRYLG